MPHGREGGRDLLAEIPVQVRQAVGVLALRRDRDPAPQDLEKRAVVEKAHGPLNGGVARHGLLSDRYGDGTGTARSEEHTSELQSLMRIYSAVFCSKTKQQFIPNTHTL